ncbi:MAG TPA: Crp/Fnr family transcriptional regulator [Gemmatimonadaceae bacterium]|nr:Crp/Fnr family transcriptional regulator [Gemmatimonadaceae bacterium]
MPASTIDELAKLPFGVGLPRDALHLLCQRSVERRYRAGQVLFRVGGTPAGIHVVLEGRVRVVREVAGRRQVLHTELSGGTLGEVPLFSGGSYPATAIAAEPSRCLLLSREVIAAAIAAHPEVAFRFLDRLANRVRELVERVDALRFAPVAVRLARHLVTRMRMRGSTCVVVLPATQEQLAEEVGTAREVLVRELRALRESGVIAAAGGGRFRVLDPDQLRRIAAG